MGDRAGRKGRTADQGGGKDGGPDSEYYDDLPPARQAVRSAQAANSCKREAAKNAEAAAGALESMARPVRDYSVAAALAHTAASIAVRACRAYAEDAAVAAGAASISSKNAATDDAKSSANHAALADFAFVNAIAAKEGSRLMREAAVAAACAKSSAAPDGGGGSRSASGGKGRAKADKAA